MTETKNSSETVRWSAYPSWKHFTWLYFASLMAGFRGLRVLWLGLSGGEVWLGGAVVLLVGAACLRRWAQYIVTSRRVIVRNGYTARDIQAVALNDIVDITVKQGPIAQFFGTGTVVIRSCSGDQVISLRGVSEPEVIKTRIDALRPGRK
jgi:membrane protein YdbS with pleckstrin-like domain